MSKGMYALGLSFPQPVGLTKKAPEGGDKYYGSRGDKLISRDSVRRMVESHGCEVNIEETMLSAGRLVTA